MPQRHSSAVSCRGEPSRPRILYGFSFSSDFVVFLCLISPESHLESNLQTAGTPCAEGAWAPEGSREEEAQEEEPLTGQVFSVAAGVFASPDA